MVLGRFTCLMSYVTHISQTASALALVFGLAEAALLIEAAPPSLSVVRWRSPRITLHHAYSANRESATLLEVVAVECRVLTSSSTSPARSPPCVVRVPLSPMLAIVSRSLGWTDPLEATSISALAASRRIRRS